MPKVSVIIPIYNVEKYLRQCLDSLVNQTLADIEIICINDGSTDGSLSILEEYASKDERIKVISQENQGQGVARNRGIELSSGEYIGFVDPDDWGELNMYEEMYSKAKFYDPDIVECTYNQYYEYSKKSKTRPNAILLQEDTIFNWKENPDYIFKSTNLSVWNKLYKSSFVKNNNIKFADTKLAQDHIFTIKSRIFANKIIFINKPLYNYRICKGSACKKETLETLKVINIVNLVKDFLQEQNLLPELNKYFIDYAALTLGRQFVYVPEKHKKNFENDIKKTFSKEIFNKYKLYKIGCKNNFEKIFSLKNSELFGEKLKILTLCGKQIFLKRKHLYENLKNNLNYTNKIPIVLAADANYAPYMYVTILSLLENKYDTSYYDIYLLVPQKFPSKLKKKFYKLLDNYINFQITFIDMGTEFSNSEKQTKHITYPTYFRLKMPQLLKNYSKVIYLDTDTIILEDLNKLYNINLDNYYIGGVIAAGYLLNIDKTINYYQKIGLPDLTSYINAGVTLWNLKKIREDNLSDKLCSFVQNNYKTADQDIVNLLFYNHIKIIDLKYNLMTKYKKEILNNNKEITEIYGDNNIQEALTNPIIIHYADKIKPWNNKRAWLSGYWWKYANKTNFFFGIKYYLKKDRLKEIFSMSNVYNKSQKKKIIYLLGFKISFNVSNNK